MKKAQVEPIQIIILFIILAVVAGIVIYIFATQSGKASNIIGTKIEGLQKDKDSDGIPDSSDICPCDINNQQPCATPICLT